MSIDNGTVSPTKIGRLVIGAVGGIKGSGAEPVAFLVTKHELEEVARYWFDKYFRTEYICSGSLEWRIHTYSYKRLVAITRVLGDERMNAMSKEILGALTAKCDAECE